MRRAILYLALPALLLPSCDWGLGTDPNDLGLSDIGRPPADHAAVVVTKAIQDEGGQPLMLSWTEYLFVLRTPPELPELLFDADISGGALLTLVLEDETATGTFQTSDPAVTLFFRAPDAAVFEPAGVCRINVTSALDGDGGGRLQAEFDCPMTDGTRDLRVLAKLDHSP